MNCGGSTHRPIACLYETLGVDKTANEKDIKNAYLTQALRLHPDKNAGQEESKLLFQEVSHAYSVLSDPAERRWYDEHRDEILNGEMGGDGGGVKLYQYRAANAFKGYADGPGSFYSVYDKAFREVFDAEATKHDLDPPSFGSRETPFVEVLSLYNWWSNFSSKLSFAWAEEHNHNAAPNRRVRRAMEKENSRARNDAKKAYDSEIQSLLAFVKRRDMRIISRKVMQKFHKKMMKEQEREIAKNRQQREASATAKAEALRERKALWMEQKMAAEAQEELEWETGEGLPIRLADIDMADDSKATTQEKIIYRCIICRKDFKSEKQHEQHCKSNIHKKKLAQFEASLALEAVNEVGVDEDETLCEDDVDGTTITNNNDKELFVVEEENVELELGETRLRSSCSFSEKEKEMREEAEELVVNADSNGNGRVTMASPLALSASEREESAATSFTSSRSREFSSDSDDNFLKAAVAEKKRGGRHSFCSSSECDNESSEEDDIEQKMQEQPNSMQNVGTKDECGGISTVKATLLEEGRRNKNRRRCRKQLYSEHVNTAGYGSSTSCLVCGENFPSRSKLFVHLKSSGHVAAKI